MKLIFLLSFLCLLFAVCCLPVLPQWVEESFTNFEKGINWRSYVVCDVAYNNVNNWLWTPFIERGEAVRRPHEHTGGVWQAVIAWLRAIRNGQGQFDKNQ